MDKRNIERYNKGAGPLSDKFNQLGARIEDIQRAFSYVVGRDHISVLELGCGNGRDAQEIIKLTDKYVGIDASREMIGLARLALPTIHFEVADMLDYGFPANVDIIFAFASLQHLDRAELTTIFAKSRLALVEKGVLYLSLKHGAYRQVVQIDQFGSSVYYLYTPETVMELAGDGYEKIYSHLYDLQGQDWLVMALRKIS